MNILKDGLAEIEGRNQNDYLKFQKVKGKLSCKYNTLNMYCRIFYKNMLECLSAKYLVNFALFNFLSG